VTNSKVHVALLRGINVGKSGRVKMVDLTRELGLAGIEVTATIVQSGNLVVTGWTATSDELARAIERAMASRLSLNTRCLIRTSTELGAVLRANPFAAALEEPSRYLVHLCDPPLTANRAKEFISDAADPANVAFAAGSLYQWCPDGISNSQPLSPLLEKRTGAAVTARNWRTLEALMAACS